MKPVKTFNVFGEPVDVLVNGAMTSGASTSLIQTTPPGGGPPPHSHRNEDETFTVLEGDFELLMNGQWLKMPVGEVAFARRGSIHAFRNVGTTVGKMLIFVAPSGLENYLEEVGHLSPVTDMAKILEISEHYGISFHLS